MAKRRMKITTTRLAGVLLLTFAAAVAFAQTPPTVGSKVTGKVAIGRNTLVLPPGEWEIIWSGESTTGLIGDAARNPAARFLAGQRDDSGVRIKAILFHVSTLVTTPVTYWNTSACDTKDALHKDYSGNFKFPECLIIDYWMAPSSPPTTSGLNKSIWDWSSVNNLKLPATFVVARYIKYKGGDYLQTHVSINPDVLGLPESVVRQRADSEWSASKLNADRVRMEYVEQVKQWGKALADQAGPTVGGGTPTSDTLPALPIAQK